MTAPVVSITGPWLISEPGSCPYCGSVPPCRPWIAASARAGYTIPTCQPVPCRCTETRETRPEWAPDRCWWTGKLDGRPRSRCDCWGRERDGRLPADCCAWEPASPRYPPALDATAPPGARPYGTVIELPEGIELDAPTDTGPDVGGDSTGLNIVNGLVTPLDPLDMPPDTSWLDGEPEPGPDPDDSDDWRPPARVKPKPYVRRWTREQLTCTCRTPWDGLKRHPGGVHCTECHENFANVAVEVMHRPRWTKPCRAPQSIVDVRDGKPLVVARMEREFLVWAIAWR